MNLKDQIFLILNEYQKKNQCPPSLRQIRLRLGNTGSLSTISCCVKEWQQKQLIEAGDLPENLTPEEEHQLVSALWTVVAPILQERILRIREHSKKLCELERVSAQKLQEEVQIQLEEITMRNNEHQRLLEQLNTLKAENSNLLAELRHSKEELQLLRTRLKIAINDREIALKDAITAKATADTLTKVMPFLTTTLASEK